MNAAKNIGLVVAGIIAAVVPRPHASAQNLVPNGSFEEYSFCPTVLGQIERASGWFYPFSCSPDYFNYCSQPGDQSDVPLNAAGFQEPFSGSGYAGLITYLSPQVAPESNFRKEVMAIQLNSPLIPGILTSLSFAVSPTGDGNQMGNRARLTCQGVGLRFTTSAVYNPFDGLPNQAALHLDVVPWDTLEWTIVAGTFVPDSAYEYLMVGNFFDDSLLTPQLLYSAHDVDVAYVFLDDVCVSQSGSCDGVGLSEYNDTSMPLVAYPNPCDGFLTLDFGISLFNKSLRVYDMRGNQVFSLELTASVTEARIDMSDLPTGVYDVRCFSQGTVTHVAIIHFH